ncbi:hypothetical protein R3P38DRAFT_3045145, partial [Favolaschia claudopus]
VILSFLISLLALTIQGPAHNTQSMGPMSSVAAIWAQVPGAGLLSPGNINIWADQPDWSFGQPFLRGVYTVLRQGNPPAVGFAELSEQGGGGSCQ